MNNILLGFHECISSSNSFAYSVCLSFLLCIVCIAETIPKLNDFIQLAPYPTKASRIGMLRLVSRSMYTTGFHLSFLVSSHALVSGIKASIECKHVLLCRIF